MLPLLPLASEARRGGLPRELELKVGVGVVVSALIALVRFITY